MSINFFSEDVDLPIINFDAIEKVMKSELRLNGKKLGNISVIFCSDDYLYNLNMKFLKHDSLTDVITFDYTEDRLISGDIFISIESVLSNSITYMQNLDKELVRVISHGLLHLLGFNDKEATDISLMRRKETNMIEKIFSLF